MGMRTPCTMALVFEIGNTLREARLRRRIDLVEAEQDTKIRSKYLGALESEEFDLLPGVVYTRGFLRTYARYLGLEPQLFIDEYNTRFGRFEDDEHMPARRVLHSSGSSRSTGFRIMLVVSLLALPALAWVGLRSETRSTSSSASGGTGGTPTGSGANRSPNDLLERAVSKTSASAIPARAGGTAGAVARVVISIQNGPSWIEVRRGSSTGPVVFSGIMQRGSVRRFAIERGIITVGAPAHTIIQRGDERISSSSGIAERWKITPAGISRLRTA
jgi:cytoskeleton protein RodZ